MAIPISGGRRVFVCVLSFFVLCFSSIHGPPARRKTARANFNQLTFQDRLNIGEIHSHGRASGPTAPPRRQ